MTFGFEAQHQANITIDATSGWPVMSTAEFRQHRRIPEFYEETVLADSLNRSVAEVQQQLVSFFMKRKDTDVTPFVLTKGVPSFSDQQISVYRGAVYARSHADLMGYFSAVDQKASANNNKSAQNEDQQNAILAQSNRAIRVLLGLGRAGVHAL